MNDTYVEKLVNEFRGQRPLYDEFCGTVYAILNKLLAADEYKCQVFNRVKDIGKLEEKLIRKKKEGKLYSSLRDIEDLAGVRIIFYIESDKDKFTKKIFQEFGDNSRLEEKHEHSGYEATHVIIGMGPKRLDLAEYAKFAGLKCEVQLTSILHHAWAEIEHDIVYKKEQGAEEGDNGRMYRKTRIQLRKIFKNYIKKASDELGNIAKRFKK